MAEILSIDNRVGNGYASNLELWEAFSSEVINQVGVDYAQAKRRAELNPPMPKASKLF
jgi:hypothetical protein